MVPHIKHVIHELLWRLYNYCKKWFVGERMVQGFYDLCQYGGIYRCPWEIQKRLQGNR